MSTVSDTFDNEQESWQWTRILTFSSRAYKCSVSSQKLMISKAGVAKQTTGLCSGIDVSKESKDQEVSNSNGICL